MRTLSCLRLPALGALLSCGAACSLAFDIDAGDYTGGADSGAPFDAAVEGAPAADSAASPCAAGGAHLLCEDFDDALTTLQDRGWPSPTIGGSAVLDVNSADWRSSPKSMFVSNTAGARAYLERPFAGTDPAGDLRFAFDVRATQAGDLIIASVSIDTYGVRFGINPDGTYNVDEWDDTGAQAKIDHPMTAKSRDAWVHVDLLVHFVKNRQPGSTFTVRIDGTLLGPPTDLHTTVDTGTPRIDFGIVDGPPSVNQLRFDNVVVDGP